GATPVLDTGGGYMLSTDATHTIEFWSVDRRGVVELSNDTQIPIDREGPAFSSDADPVYEGPATVTMTVTDANSGLSGVEFLDGASWVATSGPWVFADSAEGDYGRDFRAFDNLGNQSDYTLTYSIRPPSIPETSATVSPSPNAAGWINAAASVSLIATDTRDGLPGSGVAATYYALDGDVPLLYGTSPFTVSAQGTTTIEYWSVDRAKNEERPRTLSLRLDTTPPAVSDDHVAFYGGTTATVTVTAVDADSLVTSVQYSLDGGATQTVTPATPDTTLTVQIPLLGAGAHSLRYVAYNGADLAGGASYGVQMARVSTSVTIRRSVFKIRPRRTFYLYGTLAGGRPGDRVVVEIRKWRSWGWKRLAVVTAWTPTSNGVSWRMPYKIRVRGKYMYRARYLGDASRLPSGYSSTSWMIIR
ncbi:MAG: hypothetical protein Q7W16_08070, partial [Coriobacteriia bacterium]|nr:hypothetical protein [Coriobacteriia bacterium]